MKYTIDKNENGLDIHVDDVTDHKDKLIQAFQECQQGLCSCPTEEFKKLDSLNIDQSDAGIQLVLKSKAGEKIDQDEINRCLEYTAKRVETENNN